MPENARASRMPISKPLITRPTTAPRLVSAARCAAIGTMIWAQVAVSPMKKLEATNHAMPGLSMAETEAAPVPAATQAISRRRSS